MRLLTTGNLQPLMLRLTSSKMVVSQEQPHRTLTDIEYYKSVEYSHLHVWDSQTAKRKFLIKLEQMDKERQARSQKMHSSVKLEHPSKLNPIKLPQYIERQPSEILRTLAAAVKRDPTAPEYKYHDDPYLIPYNSISKRDFLMSKEGGRKAAQYILEKHPELFDKNLIEAQPPIKAFMPKMTICEKSVTSELLQTYIGGFDVSGSIEVYELLKTKQAIVDLPTKQSLLELICYNNGLEEMDENHNETAGIVAAESIVWSELNKAELVYQDITGDSNATPKDVSRANLTILQGMAKHKKRREAWLYYELTKDMKILDRYNAGLQCLPIDSNDFFQNWEKAKEILVEMAAEGIKPDGITLKNLLGHIRLISSAEQDFANGCKMALSVLAEFKNLGLLPSLGAYEELIYIFNQSKKSRIVYEIIEELESRLASSGESLLSLVIDPSDFSFFRTAMEKGPFRISKLDLAYKLHSLLMQHNDHQALLGNYQDVNSYYKFLVIILMKKEPLDVTMEFISNIIPHVWTPTLRFYEDLLREIQSQCGYQHLPKIWMDLQIGDFCFIKREIRYEYKRAFVDTMLMADLEASGLPNLRDTFIRIGDEIITELITTVHFRTYPLTENIHAVPLCNSVLDLALTYNDLPLAMKLVEFCRQQVTVLMGTLEGHLLLKFLDLTISSDEKPASVDCVVYAAEQRLPEALKMGQRLVDAFVLDDVEKNQLNLLFSHLTEWNKLV